MYRYFFNGTQIINEPKGWDEYITVIQKDRTIRGIFQTQNANLFFWGDGYDYLYNILSTQGYCSLVDVRIESTCDGGNTWTYFLEGLIFINLVEFDEEHCTAKTQIEDNNFYSRIYYNKGIECNVSAGQSKNAQTITAPPEYAITMFQPSSGGNYTPQGTGGFRAYRVYDIFKYLVQFMSDDSMDFTSDYFDTGIGSAYLISSSRSLISDAMFPLDIATFRNEFPKITYEKFFTEMSNRFNLQMIIENIGGKPNLRIEETDYFFPDVNLFTASNLDGLKTKTALDYIYSNVSFGTTETLDAGAFAEQINFVGFKEENYIIVGKCNIDKRLNLVCDYVTSSNVIEDMVVYQTTSDLDLLVIIECENIDGVGFTADATKTNTLNPPAPPYYYNQTLINAEVAQRWLGAIPNSIAQYLGDGNDSFKADRGSNTYLNAGGFHTVPTEFPNEISDPNANYNPATYQYTCPATGFYIFVGAAYFTGIHATNQPNGLVVIITITNTTTGDIYSQTFDYLTHTMTSNIYQTPSVIATMGDVFECSIDVDWGGADPAGSTATFRSISYFACINIATGGGIYFEYDPEAYPILQHEFDYPMSEDEFKSIKNNPIGTITFSRKGQIERKGWIESLKYNHIKGIASFILNSKK